MTHGKLIALLLTFSVAACNASSLAEQEALPPASATGTAEKPLVESSEDQANMRQENGANELSRFVEPGLTILTSQVGDLNADGAQDVVLVLNRAGSGDEKLGEGAFRSVVLLVRDASGQLQKARQNDKIVPCARCGGVAGDPFGYVRVEQGAFTALNEGGSRERWSSEYTFRYSADNKDWLLDKVTRTVSDTISGQDRQTALEKNDLGSITFEDFDPSKLPAADMP